MVIKWLSFNSVFHELPVPRKAIIKKIINFAQTKLGKL